MTMDAIKLMIQWIYLNLWDEEMFGLHMENIIQSIIKPVVFMYVCGLYAGDMKNQLVEMIEPATPTFTIN